MEIQFKVYVLLYIFRDVQWARLESCQTNAGPRGHLGNQSLEYLQLKWELQHNIQRTDCLQYCIQLQAKASSLSFNVSRFSASKTVLDTVMLRFCFSKGNENQKIRQEMIRCGIYFFKLNSWFHSKKIAQTLVSYL